MDAMRQSQLDGLVQFVAVAELGGFSAAAKRLAVSPSAVSQAVRGLEQRMGTALLHRTTRSVSLTEAGAAYLERIRPVLRELDAAEDAVGELGRRPRGTLRLNALRGAYMMVVQPLLGRFLAAYPDVNLEVVIDSGVADVVREGFDAGIRFGHAVQQDMVGIDVGPPLVAQVLAAPGYLQRKGTPRTPRELTTHECIGFRHGLSGVVERWGFEKAGERLEVPHRGRLVFNDSALLGQSALDGLGLIYTCSGYLEPFIEQGRLVRVLADWSPPLESFRLFYSSRRRVPAKLRALIEFLAANRRTTRPELGTALG